MSLLLSLETSTHSFSCALHQDNKLISYRENTTIQATASLLAVAVEELFKETGLQKSQLNAVVVASGPGSYTGLRIGVATAKGICYALNIPLISVNTLSLMAHQFVNQFSGTLDLNDALLCPMLDARRMEVYCILLSEKLNIVEPTHAKVIDEQSFVDRLDKQIIYFFGEGSDKCQTIIRHTNAKFITGLWPQASQLGSLGFQKLLNTDFEDLAGFEPFYLKDFVIKKPNLVS